MKNWWFKLYSHVSGNAEYHQELFFSYLYGASPTAWADIAESSKKNKQKKKKPKATHETSMISVELYIIYAYLNFNEE